MIGSHPFPLMKDQDLFKIFAFIFQQKYIAARETVVEDEAEEDEDEDPGKLEEYKDLLEAISESKEQNNGRIDEQYVIRFFREKLLSKPCQNQGFILDGFPKTSEQAKELFACKIITCKFALLQSCATSFCRIILKKWETLFE